MSSSRAERADARRADILSAAARLFRQRGFAGVGIDDIGAAVGISGPGVYRHYSGKQALLAEIINGYLDQVELERGLLAKQAASDDPDPHEQAGSGRRSPLLQAAITVGLRDPDSLVVYLRQIPNLESGERTGVLERRAGLTSGWDALVPPARTGDPAPATPLRLRACSGVLIGAAFARPTMSPPRADLAEAMIWSVLRTPLPPSAAHPTPPPRVPPPTRLQHASRREAILAAASTLFRERSFSAVSLRDIGAEVGITASAVNRHFPSKEELLSVMFNRAAEQIAAGIAGALAGSATAIDAVGEIIGRYARLAIECRDLIVINGTEMHFLPETERQRRRRGQRIYVEELRHVLSCAHPAMSPDEAALRARAAFSLVNEVIVSNSLARRPHLDAELTALAMAVLTPQPDPLPFS